MLLEPLTKGLTAPAEGAQDIRCVFARTATDETPMTGALLELPITKIALYTHLCELLCFFVINHSFRSKFFILSSSVTPKIAILLKARPKHIRLGECKSKYCDVPKLISLLSGPAVLPRLYQSK